MVSVVEGNSLHHFFKVNMYSPPSDEGGGIFVRK